MESPLASSEECYAGAQEDSTSTEARQEAEDVGTSTPIRDDESNGEEVEARRSNGQSPVPLPGQEQQQVACEDNNDEATSGGLMPAVSGEIKTIGVEVSEERAMMLKNDVTRLSPVLVSLRERTLGEISLNSSPQKSHGVEGDSSVSASEPPVDNGDESGGEVPPDASDKAPKELKIILHRVDDRAADSDGDYSQITNDAGANVELELPAATSNNEATCQSNDLSEQKIAVVQLFRLDEECEIKSSAVGEAKVCEDDGRPSVLSNSNGPDARESIERESGVQNPTVVDPLLVVVVEDAPEVPEVRGKEAINADSETERGADSAEAIVPQHSDASAVETANSNDHITVPDSDPLGCTDITPEMISRLEPEGPDAFTEDSAESLALATSSRDEVRSDGSDSGLGSEIPGETGAAPAPESDSETSFLDRIPDDILTDKDKGEKYFN